MTNPDEQFSPEQLEATPKAREVLQLMQKMHPEITWTFFPLGDYDQSAELDAPDVQVSFGSEHEQLDMGLVDPYSDIFGVACEPSHWNLSEEAAQILVAHNRVFLSKYPCFDGPRYLAIQASGPV